MARIDPSSVELNPQPLPPRDVRVHVTGDVELNPQPLPPREVRVHVTGDVLYNADAMKTVVSNLLGKLGCPTCHSGFDLRFIEHSDFVVGSELEVHPEPKFR